MRIKLTVAYDGTNYVGYQSQTNGVAIQDVLDQAISDLFGQPIRSMSASRTDTGVHAAGNVAVFDIETRIDPSKIAFALNARLPEDIRVTHSEQVADDFHPRFQKTVKTYEYTILNRTHPDPVRRNTELHIYGPLDENKMAAAASALLGEHDFASFCAAGSSHNSMEFPRSPRAITISSQCGMSSSSLFIPSPFSIFASKRTSLQPERSSS